MRWVYVSFFLLPLGERSFERETNILRRAELSGLAPRRVDAKKKETAKVSTDERQRHAQGALMTSSEFVRLFKETPGATAGGQGPLSSFCGQGDPPYLTEFPTGLCFRNFFHGIFIKWTRFSTELSTLYQRGFNVCTGRGALLGRSRATTWS